MNGSMLIVLWRTVWVQVWVTWGRWRSLALPVGLTLIWVFSRFSNPWDLLVFGVRSHELGLIIFPMYLFILSRDLRHPWEALVGTRVERGRLWWMAHVVSAGVSAVVVSVGLAALVVTVPLVGHAWSWQWGAYASAVAGPNGLASSAWGVPWRWGMEALGLLTLGLWAEGVLMHALSIWWRSPWVSWIALMLLVFLAIGIEGSAAQGAIWWLPGIQFSLVEHWGTDSRSSWSVVYGAALLSVTTLAGVVLADGLPWDVASGGVI